VTRIPTWASMAAIAWHTARRVSDIDAIQRHTESVRVTRSLSSKTRAAPDRREAFFRVRADIRRAARKPAKPVGVARPRSTLPMMSRRRSTD